MKTVFITVYDGDIEKNILQSAVLRTLEESEIRVVLLVKNGIVHNYRHYSRGNIVVEELPPALCASEKFFYWIGWNILPTYSGYLRRYQSYKLHRNWLRLKLGGLLSFLGRFRMFRQLLRAIYATIPDTYCQELFEKYKPDLMYAPRGVLQEGRHGPGPQNPPLFGLGRLEESVRCRGGTGDTRRNRERGARQRTGTCALPPKILEQN